MGPEGQDGDVLGVTAIAHTGRGAEDRIPNPERSDASPQGSYRT